jgi:hypothetical protein
MASRQLPASPLQLVDGLLARDALIGFGGPRSGAWTSSSRHAVRICPEIADQDAGLPHSFDTHAPRWENPRCSMAKLMEGFKDGRPELGRRTFLVPESVAEVLALLYHEQTGIVGGLPVGPVTTEPGGMVGIRMYPDQDPGILEETRKYFEKLAEQFEGDMPRA